VAEAAEKAAERLRELDDPGNGQLLKDLEELRQRLLTELHPSDEPA
jgi:signal transduction protein with GAF and PtsI domain